MKRPKIKLLQMASLAICVAAGSFPAAATVTPTAAEAPGPLAPIDFTGVWSRTREDPNRPGRNWESRPVYSQETPYRPEAKLRSEKRDPKDEPGIRCIQASMPRMMIAPYPTQVYQRPNQILVVNEANNTIRRIWLDRTKHLDDLIPTFHGDSIGRWDGQSLVVDTIGFNGKNDLDQGGTLMSSNLHVVERWSLVAGSKPKWRVEFTFDDPTMYTRPFKSIVEYDAAPQAHLREYICADNPRDFELTEKPRKPLFPVQSTPVDGPIGSGRDKPRD